MNKALKLFLVLVNGAMLILSIFWYRKDKSYEPLIVCLGQILALAGLLGEGRVSKIITKNVKDNSTVGVDVQSGDNVDTSDIVSSNVTIKTNK